jgi:sugar transferase (PEP-CTERM system associated)
MAFRRLGIVILENFLLVCLVLDAAHIRGHLSNLEDYRLYLGRAVVMALVFQVFLHLCDVYDYTRTTTFAQFTVRLGEALLLATVTLTLLYYAFPEWNVSVGRGVLSIALVLFAIFLTVWHSLLRIWVGVRAPRANLLILGTGRLAQELVSEIIRRPELGLGVCGFLDDNPDIQGQSLVNPRVLGFPADLPRIVSEHKVDRVVVELHDRRGKLPLEELLNLKTKGLAIEEATSLYERITGKIAIENLKPSWMIFNAGFEVSRGMLLQKRIFSLLCSTVLLAAFSPVMLLIALLIKLDSRGPIFHKQERIGKDGKIFTLWKFRSMCADAEKESGPVWSIRGDTRITRAGKFLRRTRLDELPQLYNIFRGDMSLVGPRPERPHFVNELASMIPFYHLRHAVTPGVTGWAQINYEYGSSVRDAVEKLQYDLFYIKNMSWLLDSIILLQTIKTVLVRRGS